MEDNQKNIPTIGATDNVPCSKQSNGNVTTTTGTSNSVPHSDTADSLVDAPNAKSFTPSMASSGYGSQAVSSQTLSSEDNNSVRSLDDTPELESKVGSNGAGGASAHSAHSSVSSDSGPDIGSERHKRLSESSLIDTDIPSNLGTPLQPLR